MTFIGAVVAALLVGWVIAPIVWPARPRARERGCTCGDPHEADARFCSNCGAPVLP